MISICYTLKNTWDGLLHSSSSWKDYPSNFLARWDFFLQPLKHHRCYWGNVCMFQSTVMPQQILAWAWVCFCLFFIIVSDFCLFFIIISDFLALLFCFLLITWEKLLSAFMCSLHDTVTFTSSAYISALINASFMLHNFVTK